jgi:hypothetical protein
MPAKPQFNNIWGRLLREFILLKKLYPEKVERIDKIIDEITLWNGLAATNVPMPSEPEPLTQQQILDNYKKAVKRWFRTGNPNHWSEAVRLYQLIEDGYKLLADAYYNYVKDESGEL